MTNSVVQSRIIPAPLLVLAFLAGGFIANNVHPLPIVSASSGLCIAIGAALVVVALAMGLAALRQFHAHRTPSSPYSPATTIVTGGIFRVTRNPMYLGFVLIAFGAGIGFNSWWLLAAAILLWLSLDLLVIRPEERYLRSRFGAEYESYAARTRRWL